FYTTSLDYMMPRPPGSTLCPYTSLFRSDPASLSATLDGFGLAFAGLDLATAGRLGLDHADVNGALTFATDLPVAERETGYRLPWRLTNDAGAWLLVSDGPQGRLEARYDQAGDLAVSADLAFSEIGRAHV